MWQKRQCRDVTIRLLLIAVWLVLGSNLFVFHSQYQIIKCIAMKRHTVSHEEACLDTLPLAFF